MRHTGNPSSLINTEKNDLTDENLVISVGFDKAKNAFKHCVLVRNDSKPFWKIVANGKDALKGAVHINFNSFRRHRNGLNGAFFRIDKKSGDCRAIF